MGIGFGVTPGRNPQTALHRPPVLDPDTFAIRDYGSHGLLLFGQMAIDLFPGVKAMAEERFKKKKLVLHAGISWTMCATFAITTEEKIPGWMKLLGIGPGHPDWLKSCDIGTSSLTMYAVLTNKPHVLRGTQPDAPKDVDDLGRCMRLLARYPDWRARLPEVAEKHPAWAHVVDRWDELARLHAEKKWKEIDAVLEPPAAPAPCDAGTAGRGDE